MDLSEFRWDEKMRERWDLFSPQPEAPKRDVERFIQVGVLEW